MYIQVEKYDASFTQNIGMAQMKKGVCPKIYTSLYMYNGYFFLLFCDP